MSATIAEKSRQLSGQSGSIVYVVKGTANEVTALNLVTSTRPATLNGLVVSTEEVSELYVQTNDESISSWLGTVTYGKSNMGTLVGIMQEEAESRNLLPEIGDTTIDFQAATQSQNILYAYNKISSYPSELVDFKKGINVDPETKKPQGADILVPTFSFTATKIYQTSSLSSGHMSNIVAATGMVNSDSFKVTDSFSGLALTFAAGEVLFAGASFGRAQLRGATAIGYEFRVIPNASNITIGGITVATKKGWDLASVYSEPVKVSDTLVQQAKQVDIMQVYIYTTFSVFGLS